MGFSVSNDGDDALLEAVFAGEWESSRELLRRTDAPSLVRYHNDHGESALHCACMYDAPHDVVGSICRHLVIDDDDEHNASRAPISSPLHLACAYAESSVVALLLRVLPRDAERPDPRTSALPLHNAVDYRRDPTVVRALLTTHPAAVRTGTRDDPSDTPLRRWTNGLRRPRGKQSDALRRPLLTGNVFALTTMTDDDMLPDERASLRKTLLLLLTARAHGEVDTALPLPLHEILRSRSGVVTGRLIRILDRKDCARHDEDRNFPLHLACVMLPF